MSHGDADAGSLTQDPDWTPTYGTDGTFTMADLLTTAGVVAPLT